MRLLKIPKSEPFSNMATKKTTGRNAWVVDVNMGYGHSRAAHSLKDLCGCKIISANDYKGIPVEDRKLWQQSRKIYEKISRLKPVPVVGDMLFEALDHWQQIPDFYPRRDLSKPNMQLRQIFRMIEKGLGKHLVEMMSENPLGVPTTIRRYAGHDEAPNRTI